MYRLALGPTFFLPNARASSSTKSSSSSSLISSKLNLRFGFSCAVEVEGMVTVDSDALPSTS